MLVHLRAQHSILVGAVHRHLEKRVRAALGPTASRVRSVTAEFSDINGPRGGEDLRCVVRVELHPKGSLRTEAVHADLFAAVGQALARARREVLEESARRERRRRAARRQARAA